MPVCQGCGASFEDKYKFCPHCGRAKPDEAQIAADVSVVKTELQVSRIREEIKELEASRERTIRLNYGNHWAVGSIFAVLGLFMLMTDLALVGIIFFFIAGPALYKAIKSTRKKNAKIEDYNEQIREKKKQVRKLLAE